VSILYFCAPRQDGCAYLNCQMKLGWPGVLWECRVQRTTYLNFDQYTNNNITICKNKTLILCLHIPMAHDPGRRTIPENIIFGEKCQKCMGLHEYLCGATQKIKSGECSKNREKSKNKIRKFATAFIKFLYPPLTTSFIL